MSNSVPEVSMRADTPSKRLGILIDGRLFTSYSFDESYPKPFFTAFLTRRGYPVTRFEPYAAEHPHQRSLFIGIGDVNGSDFWNENKNAGKQTHLRFASVGTEGNSARFTTENEWTGADGNKVLTDIREFCLTPQSEGKTLLDVSLYLMADTCDVTVGKTKEAGPLGLRLADSVRADRGGHILNASGGKGESDCWGKRSEWCLYSGKAGADECAAAILDCPENDGFPTYWHVRDYGLMAPNNLFFAGGYRLQKGECRKYRYRIVFYDNEKADTGADFASFLKVR